MIFLDIKHDKRLDGTKLGIDISFPLDKTEYSNVSFQVWADGQDISLSPYVNNRGKTVSELSFFPSFKKSDFHSLSGVELLDKIEEKINVFYIGLKDYLNAYIKNDYYKLDTNQICELDKIGTTLYFISKKLKISSVEKSNLKTQKGAKESISNFLLTIHKILTNNRYENLVLSSHQIQYDFQYTNLYFRDKGILVDAGSYFDGVINDSLFELKTHIENKIKEATKDGSNLLISLAKGDMGINEFEKKTVFV